MQRRDFHSDFHIISRDLYKCSNILQFTMSKSGSKRKQAPSEESDLPHTSSVPVRGKNLGDDLASSLDDEIMSDVTLVGSDGGSTNAIRAFLGARSDVLKSMLFGNFVESQRPIVKMNFPSAVIRGLIHFCVSDNTPNVGDELRSLADESDLSDTDLTRLAVQLCVAAEYYQISGLLVKGQDALKDWLREMAQEGKLTSTLFCAAFDETFSNPCLPRIQAYLWLLVRNKPAKRLVKNGDNIAGPSMLKSISLRVLVEDEALSAHADILFQAITMWADATPHDDFEELTKTERKDIARELISRLELRLITPPQLIGPVMASGYVESEKIVEILQKQADGGAVYICGAGIAGANGVYEQNHQYPKNDGTDIEAVYERRGNFNGMVVTFSLIARSFGHMQHWVLMAPPDGAGNVVIEDLTANRKLYYAEREHSDSTAGDNIEWNSSSEDGVAPAPSMRFLPRMASINTFWRHKDTSNLKPQAQHADRPVERRVHWNVM